MLRKEMGFDTYMWLIGWTALHKLANDSKVGRLGGQGYRSEGTQQAGVKAVKNFMKSKKDRCKALNGPTL